MYNVSNAIRTAVLPIWVAVLLPAFGLPAPRCIADGDAVAIVNGQSISKRKMVRILMESHGLQVLQQMIVLELAKEETRRLHIDVSARDIDREFNQALRRICPATGADGAALSEAEKQQVLDRLLTDNCLSRVEFMLGMERNAHLRKVVERDFKVDEATLREEFARIHGEKVEVRHVRIPAGPEGVNDLHEALNLLDQGVDFAEVARRVSHDKATANRGGLLPPFAFNDTSLAPALREAAFSLADGERVGPIKVGRWLFLLKRERRIPPADVRFEDVRDDVERGLRERVIPDLMNQRITALFQKAQIRVLDRKLKPQFEELLRQNAVTDAATMP